jgi:hypothetical protein
LLDLIEHVAFVSTGAPILLVCMARPELLDWRPGWRGLLRLEPLTPQEAQQLIAVRLSDREPDDKVSQRILAAAEGNPLFVQEMAAMRRNRATTRWQSADQALSQRGLTGSRGRAHSSRPQPSRARTVAVPTDADNDGRD